MNRSETGFLDLRVNQRGNRVHALLGTAAEVLTRQQLAEILTNCGLPVTERTLEARALRNAKPVEGAVTILTAEDRMLWAKLEMVIGEGPLTRLLAI